MPTVRKPLNRRRNRKINAAAIEAFRVGLRTQDRYLSCIQGAPCDSLNGRHCGTCRTYIEATQALRMALSLPPWHVSPLDPEVDGEMPRYMQASNLCSAKTWDEAAELRRQLDAALAEEAKGR